MDAGKQLTGIKGFGDIVVRTEFKPHDAVNVFAARREHDHGRHVLAGTQAAENLQAVFAGHHEVENERVKAFPQPDAVHRLAVFRDAYGKAVFAEVAAQQVTKARIVVHDQNLGCALFIFCHDACNSYVRRTGLPGFLQYLQETTPEKAGSALCRRGNCACYKFDCLPGKNVCYKFCGFVA